MQRHGPSCLTGPLSRRTGKTFPAASEDGKGDARQAPKPRLTQAERQARIARIRLEIAAGDYDTPEKFAIALDRLFRQLDQE
jgi:hypothetical protein